MVAPHRQVDAYIAGLESPLQELVLALRELILEAAPEAQETVKWSHPCYVQKGLFCSIMAADGYVRLQFFRGADLPDPQGFLEGIGKGMRHVKVHSLESMPTDALRALVQAAVRRNMRE